MTDGSLDRARGAMLGLACGDALGRPVEFQSPAAIEHEHGTVTEMRGDGTHGKPAGTITDDTELALCLARSLVERGRFDPTDIAERFVEWLAGGPFDVGLMTADAIRAFDRGAAWDEAGQQVWETRPEGSNAGNGSVMRCAPHALAFGDDRERLHRVSRDSSRITHADPRCTAGCAVLNDVLARLVAGEHEPLAAALDAVADVPDELHAALADVPEGLAEERLRNTGYVVHTLQTGLYHGLTATTAEDAIVAAVNMGGDTDTLGAVTGAVAGARFGAPTLPGRWLDGLMARAELDELARQLHEGTFTA